MTEPYVIHIVDDDEPVGSAFVFALQAAGFRALKYLDAEDFLRLKREGREVLVSDVRMAGMNGIELTRVLRRDGSDMPIILMTGHADSELQTDAMNAGANSVMGKPVGLAALITEITRLTAGWE